MHADTNQKYHHSRLQSTPRNTRKKLQTRQTFHKFGGIMASMKQTTIDSEYFVLKKNHYIEFS